MQIKIKVQPNEKQLADIKKILSHRNAHKIPFGKTMSPIMDYLVEHFSKDISEALFNEHKDEKDISPE